MSEPRLGVLVMLAPPAHVIVTWRSLAATDAALRARATEDIRGLWWTLAQTEALLHDAHRVAGHEHAFLMPRIELRLPLYDLDRRLRIVFTHVDGTRIRLVDEHDRKLADITLH